MTRCVRPAPAAGFGRFGAVLAGLVLLVSASAALGFATQGRTWPNQPAAPVSFRIQPDAAPQVTDGSDLRAIRNAFTTWQSQACSNLRFKEDPWVEPAVVQADQMNRIFWSASTTNWPDAQQGTLALTYTFYNVATPLVIIDADIILNALHWKWSTSGSNIAARTVDVETVVLHEIGHFFGLNHSTDTTAVMYPSANKPTQHAPTVDDINAICTLYRNNQSTPAPNSQPGASGAPCTQARDCASALCLEDPSVGLTYCTSTCVENAPACPAGLECRASSDNKAYCVVPRPVDELCDQCASGDQCATGLCLAVPGYNQYQSFCTSTCDPTPGITQCPTSYTCVAIATSGQTGGVCAPNSGLCNPSGIGGQAQPCYANGGCKPGLVCSNYGTTGLSFCYAECPYGFIGSGCDATRSGIQCMAVSGQENKSACFPIAAAGEPCVPEVCDSSSTCAFGDTGVNTAICYRTCAQGQSQCPANTQCQQVSGLGALCVPNARFKYLGDSCESDEECRDQLCRNFGQTKLCTKTCQPTDTNSCPRGTECLPGVDRTAGLCRPANFNGSTTMATTDGGVAETIVRVIEPMPAMPTAAATLIVAGVAAAKWRPLDPPWRCGRS